MTKITYRESTNINSEALSHLIISSGIKRPANDLNRLQKMIDNADIIITVQDNEELVGIARVITDYCYCCYLSDLAVSKSFRVKA